MKSLAQISQDVFTFHFFNREPGFFVDVGCGDGSSLPNGNNTLLLEQNGWSGISIDYNPSYVRSFNSMRKTKAILADMTNKPLGDILDEAGAPKIIDYLSFDVDDATEAVMDNMPFDRYEFRLITFEHNLYCQPELKLQERGMNMFSKYGYERLIENVILLPQGPVEDWYLHPRLTSALKTIKLKDVLHDKICSIYGFD